MINKLPFFFESEGVDYFYDDSTGIVLPINEDEKEFLNKIEIGSSIEDYEYTQEQSVLVEKIKRYNLFSYPNSGKVIVKEDDIPDMITQNGINHMCLILTDACNFRCKYCIYSEHYYYNKHYSNKAMSFENAKKAVDYYFKINSNSRTYNPNLRTSIGFYGGEPLICWDLITKIVEYVKSIDENCIFSITTNAMLLSKEKIDYMLENRFSVSVSLDGGKEEHDRNRVDINNHGTFDTVFSNLLELKKSVKKREENKAEVLPYYILMTCDNLTDLVSINDFFRKNPELQKHIFKISNVDNQNTDYYNQQQQADVLLKREQQLKLLLDEYKNNLISGVENNFLKCLFTGFTLACESKVCFSKSTFRGACIPGMHKLAVDVEGNFHICEKINPNYPIGNINEGLNYKKIANYLNELMDLLDENCKNCNITRMCNMCFVNIASDGRFVFNKDLCDEVKMSMTSTLGLYYYLLQND